jgi:hypothetical protein
MIGYWRRRFLGPAPRADREATRAEAYTDFLEAQNVALRAQLADRDQQLQLAGILVFYWRSRAERGPVDDRTVVIPAARLRRWRHRAERTEVFRR